MKALSVGLPQDRYDILIGDGILADAGKLIAPVTKKNAGTVVVTDETVWGLYRERLTAALSDVGIRAEAVVLPPGEANKSMDGLSRLYGAFAKAGLNRSGLVLAFGGGVIGDLAGFAAATYMRGVDYVQIPTTLLAQVDSSVGGKTAINLPEGKNLAGAFYQPRLVLADTGLLQTLPDRELRCGMAEVVKYGAIRSRELFDTLRDNASDPAGTVEACCRIKSGIVERDERDTGERMILNFGHTFGHGVEALGQYSAYNHGEAVAIGMAIAAEVGEELGVTRPGCSVEIRRLLAAKGLEAACPYSAADLMKHIRLDKKGGGDGVKVILLRDIGEAVIQDMDLARLQAVMERTEARWKIQS